MDLEQITIILAEIESHYRDQLTKVTSIGDLDEIESEFVGKKARLLASIVSLERWSLRFVHSLEKS